VAGVGLGLRWEIDEALVETLPPLDFLELAPENYIRRGGYHGDALEYLAAHYPLVTHGLSLSLGGVDPLDQGYMRDVAGLVRDLGSPWHSDHLSFGTSRGRSLHDLLPIAFTEAGVRRLVDRVRRAQDAIGVPLAVENISFYLPPAADEMPEAEFIARVCDGSGCGLLLDVNNLYVNATNFGFDPRAWLDVVPLDHVVQMHIAGHAWFDESLTPRRSGEAGALIIDTHGAAVTSPVLALFGEVIRRIGPVPVLLERDHEVPPLAVLLEEVSALKAVIASALGAEEGTGGREVGEPPGERRHVEVGGPGLSKRVPERGAREEG
jgi:uncharacterized protein (UPF0276 family)